MRLKRTTHYFQPRGGGGIGRGGSEGSESLEDGRTP